MRAHRPSDTSLLIAKSTVMTGTHPAFHQLVPEAAVESCRWILDDLLGPNARRRIESTAYPRLQYFMERAIIPGIQLHYALRKRQLEAFTVQAIKQGATQLVVLGAGYDSLARRMAEQFPHLQCVELDHPATQRVKVHSLESRSAIPENLHFQAIDLMHHTACLESAPPVDRTRPTMVIAEGVFMYLSETVVKELLTHMWQTFSNGCSIAFTFMHPDLQGRIRFHNASALATLWLKMKNEPFTWGLPRHDLPSFLDGCGFSEPEIVDHHALRARFLEPAGLHHHLLAIGEAICFSQGSQ